MLSFVTSIFSFLSPLFLSRLYYVIQIYWTDFITKSWNVCFQECFLSRTMSTYCIMALSSIIYDFLQPVSTTYAKSCVHRIRYCGRSGTWGIVNRTHNILLTSWHILFSFTPIIIIDVNLMGLRWVWFLSFATIWLYFFLPFTELKRQLFNKINIVDCLILSLCIHSVGKLGFH